MYIETNTRYATSTHTIALEPLLDDIKAAGPFLYQDNIDATEELMDEFNLSTARFTFMPSLGWSYAILADGGLEYVDGLQLGDDTSSLFGLNKGTKFDLIQHTPMVLQLLALIGPEPDDSLLAEFRSCRYQWIGLREDIDRNDFYTQKNISAIWEAPMEATKYFMNDRDKTLKLAGQLY